MIWIFAANAAYAASGAAGYAAVVLVLCFQCHNIIPGTESPGRKEIGVSHRVLS
jgi:hypothetical protein